MTKLKEKGLQMIAFFGIFAKESVSIRCNEIKNMLKDFEAKLEARKQLLQVSLDVFTCLDQVRIMYAKYEHYNILTKKYLILLL